MNWDYLGDPWVGVDLDGTLAEYTGFKGIYHIGRPVMPMMERLQRWCEVGYRVEDRNGLVIVTVKRFKIFTARVCQTDAAMNKRVVIVIQDWLEAYWLPRLEVTARKDLACLEIWDDRCRRVASNEGYRCY